MANVRKDDLGNILPVGISCNKPRFRAILHTEDRSYTATKSTKEEAELALQELKELHPDYFYNWVATVPRYYAVQVRAYDKNGKRLYLRTTAPTLEGAKERAAWFRKRYDTEDRRTIKYKRKDHG